ncbi:MAG: N-acetylmuramoyl-L-alanine amidase [Nitrospira sp.]|nr:N-acetylmuramoyl-L-alanine amidase [Nitrospira sp.]
MIAWTLAAPSASFCSALVNDHSSLSRSAIPTKAPKIQHSPLPRSPAAVRNVRVWSTAEKTRLVLDLDRPVRPTERRTSNPAQVMILLPHTSLSPSARTKVDNGSLPPLVTITQTEGPTVSVAFRLNNFRSYKQFTLSAPHRLVIDMVPQGEPSLPRPLASHESPSSSIESPVQPVIPPPKSLTTIVIDPGHGGKDVGALGQYTEEKDITLKVGLALRDLLNKQPGFEVLMTRDRDIFVELEERTKFANKHNADVFVSIHVNSHPSHHVKGVEIYHFGEAKDQRALEVAARENGTPINGTAVGWEYLVADLLTAKKIESSLELAWTTKEAMIAHLSHRYPIHDHGVKTAPFYVLRFTTMPSILAEIAFISNPDDERLLRQSSYLNDIALSLYKGIMAFLTTNRNGGR